MFRIDVLLASDVSVHLSERLDLHVDANGAVTVIFASSARNLVPGGTTGTVSHVYARG